MLVRPMGADDVVEAAALLAAAFADRTNLASLVPARAREERLRRWFEWTAVDVLRRGVAEVAVPEVGPDRTILAVAWWHRPDGRRTRRSHGPRRRRLEHAVRGPVVAVRVFGAAGLLSAARSYLASRGARPGDPHWHLAYLAASPAPEARGAATALLVHRTAETDRQGVGVHLESSSPGTVGFYERLGWQVTVPVPGPRGRSTTAMWRPVDKAGR